MDACVKDIIQLMDTWAPPSLAESWDHPGLQVGDPKQPVHTVLVSLDLTRDNLNYAIANKVDMIVSHHPFLFKSVKNIDLQTEKGQMIADLFNFHISAFAAHTNLDTAQGGVNDALASALKLKHCTGFIPIQKKKQYKLVVYVPKSHAETVRAAIARAGGGVAGAYRGCSFVSSGTGYFFADSEAHPFSGKAGTENKADEVRIETFIEENALNAVKLAIHGAHPYELPIYNIYELVSSEKWETMGRIGELPHLMSGEEAVLYVKECLGIELVKFTGKPEQIIQKIAVLGGAGAEFIPLAKSAGADLYLTGDVKYHEAQEAKALGLFLVDGGHFYTERVIIPWIAKYLQQAARERDWNLTIIEDPGASDIFSYR